MDAKVEQINKPKVESTEEKIHKLEVQVSGLVAQINEKNVLIDVYKGQLNAALGAVCEVQAKNILLSQNHPRMT